MSASRNTYTRLMPSEACSLILVGSEAVVEGAEPDPRTIHYQAVVIRKSVVRISSNNVVILGAITALHFVG